LRGLPRIGQREREEREENFVAARDFPQRLVDEGVEARGVDRGRRVPILSRSVSRSLSHAHPRRMKK
jgi:hypothetical protein